MATKKRGVSAEEKRTRILAIFTQSKDVFQMKDLEKLGPKHGMAGPVAKEVVGLLVGDGLVECEKIGTSTYYWSFPGKLNQAKKARLKELTEKVHALRKKQETLKEQVEELESGADDKENKEELMKELLELRAERDRLKKDIAKFSDCDPEMINKYQEDIDYAKDGINRWTDNVFGLRNWVKEKTYNDESTVNKMFGIPDDFDYPDNI